MAALEVLVDLVELAEVVVWLEAMLGLMALEATPPLALVEVFAKGGEPPSSFQNLTMIML